MKNVISMVVLLTWSIFSFGQVKFVENSGSTVYSDGVRGYYITSERTVSEITLLKTSSKQRAHAIVVPKQENHEYKLFYPTDIIGYGFEDGTRYCSATIYLDGKVQTVFLEELIKGADNLTIYVYDAGEREQYFVQRGKQPAQLVADNGEGIRNYLRNKAGDCPKIEAIDKYPMKMTRSSINKMYEAYTNCNLNVFTRFRYGITGGISMKMLKLGNNRDFKYDKEVIFYPGIFVEIPLDIRFSFRPEFIYTCSSATGKADKITDKSKKMEYKRKAIFIPFMFRYKMTNFNDKYIPYVEVGPTLDLRISGMKKNNSSTNKHQVSPCLYGAAVGIGTEFKITNTLSLYAGLRYNAMTGVSPDEEKETDNILSLNFSIGF